MRPLPLRPARRVAASVLVAGLLAAAPARAEEPDAATQAGMQAVITQQLDAFAHDDATRAESFAAPGIKTMFPDVNGFIDMVRKSYAPLIRPRSTHFGKAGTTALGPMQSMTVVDGQGGAWTAVYTFEQVDGQWRISGCVLMKEESTTI